VAILSTAIVFIFRAFTTVLSATKLSQNITLACLLAESKLWEIEQRYKDNKQPLGREGEEIIQDKEFRWDYTTEPILEFNVTWQENANKEEKYSIATYLPPK
jgi:hypothetical protein